MMIERVDGSTFDQDDANTALDALWLAMSFACGYLVGFVMPTGYSDEDRVFVEFSIRAVDPKVVRLSWYHVSLEEEPIFELATAIMEASTDEVTATVLQRVIRLTIAANRDIESDVSIPIAQSTLEMLAWLILVEREGWLKEIPRNSAAMQVRLLMRWLGMDTEVPAELSSLAAYGRKFTDKQLPEAIVLVRNNLVHPNSRSASKQELTGDVLMDTWRITTEIVDLAILKMLGYEGEYVHRRHMRGHRYGQTDPVPWATPT